MPDLSSHVLGLMGGGSDGWAVFYRARAMAAAGEQVTELTIGQHDDPTDTAVLDVMHGAAKDGLTGYAEVPGFAPLRDAVARRTEARTGVPTTRENVLIVPGGQGALYAAHVGTCEPGDRALFIDPYYTNYPGTIRGSGAEPVAIEAKAEDGFLPRAEAIRAEAADAKSLLINTPNNPTGVVYPSETLEDIGEVADAHDLWLISDEVYDTQVWEGEHISPRALPGLEHRTLVVGSMSKSHAMTGSRVGWLIAPPDVIAALTNLSLVTTYGVPGFLQEAARFALEQGEGFEDQIAEPFLRRRALVLETLEGSEIDAVPSHGAMYLMLDIRATGLSGEAFAEALLDARRIAVMPGESFGKAAAGHIRIALTVDDERLVDAVRTLLDFAEGYARAA